MFDPLEYLAELMVQGDALGAFWFVLALPAFLLAHWVRRRFRNVLNQYLRVASANGFTGITAARRLLEHGGVRGVRIMPTHGLLVTDHYNPLTRELALSQGIIHSPSVAAVGIAAHEAGHAIQHARNYFPVWLRSLLVPVTRVCFFLGFFLIIFAVISAPHLVWVGMAVFGCCLLFPVITLPVEFDASARARELALEAGIINAAEQEGMDRVLRAAAFTYVARAVNAGFVFLVLAGYLALNGGQGDSFDPGGMPGPGPLTVLVGLVVALGLCFQQRRRKATAPGPTESNNAGNLLAGQGEYAEAVAAFTKAIRLSPGFAEAYANRGAIYSRTARYDEALADLDAAVRLGPGRAEFHVCRGHVLACRGEYDAALADYNEALRLAPDRASQVYASRGAVWLAQDEYDRAIADCTAALDRGGGGANALRDRGLAWFFKGDPDRAIADLDEAIRLAPADGVAYNNRAAALLKKGDFARAVGDLRQAIQLAPDLPNPYRHLAWLQATCPEAEFRDGASALANATRAWRLTEGKKVAWLEVLAAAHAETGDFAEAVRLQAQCAAASPPEMQADLRARLDRYRAGQPFRDYPKALAELT